MLIHLLWTAKRSLARLAQNSRVQCDEWALNLGSARTRAGMLSGWAAISSVCLGICTKALNNAGNESDDYGTEGWLFACVIGGWVCVESVA